MKYLLGEGLKNYKIPLPLVLSKKIGKHHAGENDKMYVCVRGISQMQSLKERVKKEKGLQVLFGL